MHPAGVRYLEAPCDRPAETVRRLRLYLMGVKRISRIYELDIRHSSGESFCGRTSWGRRAPRRLAAVRQIARARAVPAPWIAMDSFGHRWRRRDIHEGPRRGPAIVC